MADFCIRKLCFEDIENGFLTTLDALRPTSHGDPTDTAAVFERLARNPDVVVAVAEHQGRVIGTGTLYFMHKFLYGGSVVGLIEDVAVATTQQHAGIGRAIIDFLLTHAQAAGCYKTVLYCEAEAMPFYRKFDFRHTTQGMRHDHTAPTNQRGNP